MSWQKPEILEVCRLEVHLVKLILKDIKLFGKYCREYTTNKHNNYFVHYFQ